MTLAGQASVGLVRRPFFRLHDDRGLTTMFGEQFEQPVVETPDFHDGQITPVRDGQFPDFIEVRADVAPLGADLPSEDDVPRPVPSADGQLLAVPVDADVQQDVVILGP